MERFRHLARYDNPRRIQNAYAEPVLTQRGHITIGQFPVPRRHGSRIGNSGLHKQICIKSPRDAVVRIEHLSTHITTEANNPVAEHAFLSRGVRGIDVRRSRRTCVHGNRCRRSAHQEPRRVHGDDSRRVRKRIHDKLCEHRIATGSQPRAGDSPPRQANSILVRMHIKSPDTRRSRDSIIGVP